MTIKKCSCGYFYDTAKFEKCPNCENSANALFDDETTEALYGTEWQDNERLEGTIELEAELGEYRDDEKTIGMFSMEKGTDFPVGWLVCTAGIEKGRDYRLHHGWNRIGRSINMDIYVSGDLTISSESNAAVVYDDRSNRFFAVSEAGKLAYLNNEPLRDVQELTAGDVIKIGISEFTFIPFCEGKRKW